MNDVVLNKKRTAEKVGLSLPTIWRLEKRGLFPARRALSPGRVGFLLSEVEQWIIERQKVIVPSSESGGAA
jgi:prophage regulatory protein